MDIRAGSKFSCDVDGKLKSFYRAANALLHKSSAVGIDKMRDMLYFLYLRYCVPILGYGYSVISSCLSNRDAHRLKVAHNSMVRRIFAISRYDSVPAQFSFGTCMAL